MQKSTLFILSIIVVIGAALRVVLATINSVPTNTNSFPFVVTVYKDVNYLGDSQKYGVGSYTLSQMQTNGTGNDSISSIEVSQGYSVTLYQEDNFQGHSITKTGDYPNLVDDNWNDEVSSMKVEKTKL